ncbi:MAG: hypothetical protein WCM76_13300 [Bacteroidota bacterium]
MRKLFMLTALCLLVAGGAFAQLVKNPPTVIKHTKSTYVTATSDSPVYLGMEKPADLSNSGTNVSSNDMQLPKLVNTGDALKDAETYRIAKEKWIRENPAKYEEIVKQNQIKK